MSVLVGHALGKVVPLRERRVEVPPSIVTVVAKAMARRPTDRFATADALRRALEAARTSPSRTWSRRSPGEPRPSPCFRFGI